MADCLSRFEQGDLGIGQVIADLRGLLAALESTPQPWRDEFQGEWGDLEIEYASALEQQKPLPDVSDAVVGPAARNMVDLVKEQLRLYE
jgi:hypothetical protein